MKKKIYIQILGVIACLAVVAMHVNGCFWRSAMTGTGSPQIL